MNDIYCINCGEGENIAATGTYPSGTRYECNECGGIFYDNSNE
ncbi:hypothetical protein [Bacillus pseudomycoides]|nr:hypothetical protein [Bacillus pseudomycoides]